MTTVECPRCGRACAVGAHASAHCPRCFTSFRADDPTACLTRAERERTTEQETTMTPNDRNDAAAVAWLLMVRRFGLDAIRPAPIDTGAVHGPTDEVQR